MTNIPKVICLIIIALTFFNSFHNMFDSWYEEDVAALVHITLPYHVSQSSYSNTLWYIEFVFSENKFTVHMSSDSYHFLEKIIESSSRYEVLMQIITQRIRIISML
ncbi:hypothetical protein RF11_07896 [Thelohanellus kitauei]|uniref:TFIID subunit TAF5 NTD2 domain-containing protein n=1 Tax=Thelohanellus kitauei TaxID=669202 RepID=A0A0C2M890_THEKT|nr:hypothetical protein RF11_07896 [Thelohanellus kitauei]